MEKDIIINYIKNVCIYSAFTTIATNTLGSIKASMTNKIKKTNYDKLIDLEYTGIDEKVVDDLNINILETYQYIYDIYYKLGSYTSKSNMHNAYKNIKTLQINKFDSNVFAGRYNIKSNEILYSNISAIPHEFLHMSSAFYDYINNISYDGFAITSKEGKIGTGLNEGYTELLSSRIYNCGRIDAYKKEVKTTSIIEQFFNNPKEMENYYFNHNLKGFIEYMTKYTSKEEMKNLIRNIDLITDTRGHFSNAPTYYYMKVLNILNNISNSPNLEVSQKKKIKNMINNNIIMKAINKSNQLILKKF